MIAEPICFRFEEQTACRAFSRAWANTGNRMAARMAMMAITTSSSMRVNAAFRRDRMVGLLYGRKTEDHSLTGSTERCLFPTRLDVPGALLRSGNGFHQGMEGLPECGQ